MNEYEFCKKIETEYIDGLEDVEKFLTAVKVDCTLSGKYIKLDCCDCLRVRKVTLAINPKTGFLIWRCWSDKCNCSAKYGTNLIGLLKGYLGVNYVEATELIRNYFTKNLV